MIICKGIMKYLNEFSFYLRISTALKKTTFQSVLEIMENERAEFCVDTRIRTDILIKNNNSDIFIYDKRENEINIVEVCITSQDNSKLLNQRKRGNMNSWRMS
ncbi:hypothetical protein TCON_0538 [Astathelohania contejeani]|uniref:Uncharacterized protein n=1 Tax=Astathelohania contejeani TaxID=164912 RepID=A0ABQ7I1B8_9MICR|nr:hypothetical protein TCON_0538 [Thelohania contejeani]